MSDNLKPCPFCKGNVHFCKDEDHECERVHCDKCGMFEFNVPNADEITLQQRQEYVVALWGRADLAQPVAPVVDERAALHSAISEAISGLYYCGRVWSAWGVGTMTEDDFSPANEESDVIDEIVSAAIDIRARTAPPLSIPRSDSVDALRSINAVLIERDNPVSPIAAARCGFEAAYRLASPTSTQKAIPTLNIPEIITYVSRYGGDCRDCADENGVCPQSGLPCGGKAKAVKHVLTALDYGLKNGFIVSQPKALSENPIGYINRPDIARLSNYKATIWPSANEIDAVAVYANADSGEGNITQPKALTDEDHPDNLAIDKFTVALKEEMAIQRKKGRSGWDKPEECSQKHLYSLLTKAVMNRKFIAAGNYSMMLHIRALLEGAK